MAKEAYIPDLRGREVCGSVKRGASSTEREQFMGEERPIYMKCADARQAACVDEPAASARAGATAAVVEAIGLLQYGLCAFVKSGQSEVALRVRLNLGASSSSGRE